MNHTGHVTRRMIAIGKTQLFDVKGYSLIAYEKTLCLLTFEPLISEEEREMRLVAKQDKRMESSAENF